jgi:hypothetical protein
VVNSDGACSAVVMGIFLRLTQAVLSLFGQDAKKKPKFAYGLCDLEAANSNCVTTVESTDWQIADCVLSTGRLTRVSNFLSTVLSRITFQVAKTR